MEITKRFQVKWKDKFIAMVFDEAKLNHDPRFLLKNVAIEPSQATALFSTPSHSFDMRNHQGVLYQAVYLTAQVADDMVFEVEGYKPGAEGQFYLAYAPIVPGKASPLQPE